MHSTSLRDIILFSLITIILVFFIDYLFYLNLGVLDSLTLLAWGALRMYTPTVTTYIIGGLNPIKSSLKVSRRVIYLYFLAPFVTFLTFSFYILIIYFIGAFTFDYIERTIQVTSINVPIFLLLTFINVYIAAISLNALYAIGEEIGWRGFLQQRFESLGLSFVKSSLMVGLVWGVWHASAIILLGYNYPENRLLGIPLFTLFTISASIPHSIITKSSSSILPAASLHGAINAIWGLTILTTTLPRELAGLGPIAFISWTATSLIMFIVFSRMLKQR